MGYLPYQLVQDVFIKTVPPSEDHQKACISRLIRHTHLMKTLSRDAWSMLGMWVVSDLRKSKEWFIWYTILTGWLLQQSHHPVVVWLVMIKPILTFFVLTWRSLVMRNRVFGICKFWISYIPLSELLAQSITSWLVGLQLWQLWSVIISYKMGPY